MSYKSLYKLFVMNDNAKFNEIYNKKFNSDSTIKFDIYINDNQAFFTYDKDIMALTSKIRELDYKINDIFKNLPLLAIEQYMRKSLIDEIEYTNQIEGVVSTRKDINDLINEIEKKAKIKNRFEGIVNKYLMLATDNIEFKSSSDVRNLYNEMLYDEIKDEDQNNLPDGEIFRKNIVHVFKNDIKEVHSGLMPEAKIIEYMDKALNILNDSSIDILIRVSIFHYFFGYIHPFYDGNGRTNRFISSYVLSKYFNKVIGFRLSMTIKENLSQYLDAFNHTNDVRNKGDVSTFVYEFLDIIYKSYQKTQLYALDKKSVFDKYENIIDNLTLFEHHKNNLLIKELLSILTQSTIFGDFGLSKTNICSILEKGNTKVTEILGILKEHNLIIVSESRKHCYYKINLDELNKYNKYY